MEYKITSKQLRKAWIDFYEKRGHVNIGSVSLVGDGTTGVMFNVAGMQPLMPYLLGKKHPMGNRLCNVQGCVRTNDIESVGDESHCTFFEMMGSWSLGDYFKKERTQWSYELLTQVFGFSSDKIAATVFMGNSDVPKDEETAKLREESGIKKENIFYLPKEDNWWELEIGPCGPDSEMFYIKSDIPCCDECTPACKCGRFVEIGNDVFMQYEKTSEGNYIQLKQKNVDTGWGLERNLIFLNNVQDVYQTDLFEEVIAYMEQKTNIKYRQDKTSTRAMRIVADHLRTSTMLIGDQNGTVPSNVGPGYILRRLLRRAIRFSKTLGLDKEDLKNISKIFIESVYNETYPFLLNKKQYILSEIEKEDDKFSKTIEQGTKEFNKLVDNLIKFAPDNKRISGEKAFRLLDTFGFPIELTIEMAEERGFTVDKEGYKKAFEHHQEISRNLDKGEAKGGLAERTQMTTYLHTATHLLLGSLRYILKQDINQRGSNINNERLRFDFNFDRKLTEEEIKAVEDRVNEAIKAKIEVTMNEMSVEEAHKSGAIGIFDSKYGDIVKVYNIEGYDKEICGGPHAKNTSELKHFKIVKEEASSAGIRRIKAILELD